MPIKACVDGFLVLPEMLVAQSKMLPEALVVLSEMLVAETEALVVQSDELVTLLIIPLECRR